MSLQTQLRLSSESVEAPLTDMWQSGHKLTPPAGRYVQVSICLNRVHLDGLTPDAAIAKLIEMGYTPEIRYQLNPQRHEFDLYAVIHEKHAS